MGGALALSGIHLNQQLLGEYTYDTLRGFVRQAMPITDLLDRARGELHHWSGSD